MPPRPTELDRDRGVRWGQWRREDDLLRLHLVDELVRVEPPDVPLALVCTQGQHDLCCAVEGRPVVAAADADSRFDAWECSHLGGDRFAANLLLLPSGILFGGLTTATAATVLDAAATGRVVLQHYRGRCGDPSPAQATQWFLMRALGEARPETVTVDPPAAADTLARPAGAVTMTAEHAGTRYRLDLTWTASEPAHLTCRARGDARFRSWNLERVQEFSRM